MSKKQTLGKVIDQIGGLRIREITTKDGLEYGLYAGKRLFKQMLNPDTLRVMAHKIKAHQDSLTVKVKGHVNPVGWSYKRLLDEYQKFMKNK